MERILQESGAKEFHCSARHSVPSFMEYKNTNTSMGGTLSPPEFVKKVASYEKVKNLVFVARSVLPSSGNTEADSLPTSDRDLN